MNSSMNFPHGKGYVLLFLLLVAIPYLAIGQSNFCAHDEYMDDLRAEDSVAFFRAEQAFIQSVQYYRQTHPGINYLPNPIPSESLTGGSGCDYAKYILPVVVHVIYDPTVPASNIDSNQVFNQIEILNKAFRNELDSILGDSSVNTSIQFCLAKKKPDGTPFSGITWTQSSYGKHKRNHLDSLAYLSGFPSNRYINIYVVTDILEPNGNPSGWIGYSTFPYYIYGSEGVVVKYNKFGDYNTYGSPLDTSSLGKTLVHELGHYLGLFHPFKDSCSGMSISNCATEGDLCCDVPPVGIVDDNCSGSPPINTCNESYNGDLPDQKENHMDYTDPSCRNTFTRDQTDIMHSVLDGKRRFLWQVANLNELNLSCCVHSANFTTLDLICMNEAADLIAYDYENANYRWQIYKTGTGLYKDTTISSNELELFPDTGDYDIRLTITVSGESFQIFKPNALTVSGCDSPLHSTQGNWYFGEFAGLRFYENGVFRDLEPFFKAVSLPQINSAVGVISISDTAGNLLYYAGRKDLTNNSSNDSLGFIWDKNLNLMNNVPIYMPFHEAQGIISIPFRNAPNRYHVFTTGRWNLFHHVIDLDSGTNGDIILKNENITDSFGISLDCHQGITAIPQCGDSTFWLLVPVYHNSKSKINIFQISDTGVAWYDRYMIPFQSGPECQIKASPDGNLLSLDNNVFTFDQQNGDIELLWHDSTSLFDDSTSFLYRIYSAAFSPDSRLLYRHEFYRDDDTVQFPKPYNNFIYQIDPYAANIGASKRLVAVRSSGAGSGPSGESVMQIGPNDRIYVSNWGSPYLSHIVKPNNRVISGNECQYEEIGVTLQRNGIGGTSRRGLPNFVDAKFDEDKTLGFKVSYKACGTVRLVPDRCCESAYKWIFGDGDTSLARTPTHIYEDTGSYLIQLVIESDTVVKSIHIGLHSSDISITGQSVICDSTLIYQYGVIVTPEDSGYYSYTWTVQNAQYSFSDYDFIQAKWNSNGYAKVIIEDTKTGCKDSTDISITYNNTITNNTISSDEWLCGNSQVNLTGSTPSGGSGSFTYQWYKKEEGGSYFLIPGATSKDYNSETIQTNTTFYREAISGACRHPSNEIKITVLGLENHVLLSNSPCYPGDSLAIDGNDLTGGPFVTYQWQYREPQAFNWTSIQAYSGEDLNIIQIVDSMYYRRVATYVSPSCVTYSDSVLISPDVFYIKHPQDDTLCGEFDEFQFTVQVSNKKEYEISYLWQLKDKDSTFWRQTSRGSDTVTSLAGHHTTSHLDTFRYYVSTVCGFLYSDKAVLRVENNSPGISSHPSDRAFYVGDTMDLTATPSGSWSKVFWQVKENGSFIWSTIPDSDSTTLIQPGADLCDDSSQYRMGVQNVCGTTYSNPAWVTVVDFSDLWMMDSDRDTGSEPNMFVSGSTITYDLFSSPDLWNCNSSPTCTTPQNAEFHLTSPNYARVKVRNRGSLTSSGSRLRLYWTLASTGEIWDVSWTDNPSNRFYNSDSMKYYPMGGEITLDTIHIIDSLVVGDSIIYTFQWYPPDPDWYAVDSTYHLGFKSSACLYARIEHCDAYPHGMTYPEQFNIKITDNVRKNNNIVTRNLWIFDAVPGQSPGGTIKIAVGRLPGPPNERSWMGMYFDAREEDNLDQWNVVIELDDSIKNHWYEGGAVGTNLEATDSTHLTVTGNGFRMDSIYMYNNELAVLSVNFTPKVDPSLLPMKKFYFSLSQFQVDYADPDGGFIFLLDNSTGQMSASSPPPEALSTVSPETGQAGWEVIPNPARNSTVVNFNIPEDGEVEIELTDIMGRTVFKHNKYYGKGSHHEEIDLKGLNSAVYFVRFKYEGRYEYKRLLIE